MIFRRPSPRLWLARQTVLAMVGVPLLLAAGGAGLTLGPLVGLAAAVAAIVVLGVGWLIARGRYRSWGYVERDDDLLIRRGLWFRQLAVVPYGRMQFIDVSAGPIDRLFGLATIQLHTAAATTDARIPGLLQAEADRLRDRLASVGEAQATGL